MEKVKSGEEKQPLFGGNKSDKSFSFKDKKLLFKLALIIVLGVFLMTLGNFGKSSVQEENQETTSRSGDYYSDEKALESRLEEILSMISGAGEVKVAVSFKTSKEVEYAYNSETSESMSWGDGSESFSPAQDNENSESLTLVTDDDSPVVVKEYMPEIQGVLVVATGASDPQVKQKLFAAVQGLLALPAHRIVISN